MAVSQAAMQSTPRIAAVIFLTAATRITIAVFIGRSDFHQRMQTITARNTKKSPQPSPQINPVWNPES
jgi:hypothetical protein